MSKKLYPKPKQISHEISSILDVPKYRKLDCMFYGICLSHAAYLQWDNFSCMECNLYIPNPEYLKELEMEYANCIRITNQVEPHKKSNGGSKLQQSETEKKPSGKLKLKRLSDLNKEQPKEVYKRRISL